MIASGRSTSGAILTARERPATRGSRADSWAFALLVATAFSAPIGNNIRVLGNPSIFPFRVFLVAFMAAATVGWIIRGRPRPSLSWRNPEVLWVVIVAWALLSLLWAQDRGLGIRSLGFLIQGTVLMLGASAYGRQRNRLAALMAAGVAGLGIAIACALYERATLYRFPASRMTDPLLAWEHYYVYTGLFHNPNDFATYLALWFPLVLQAYLEGPKRWMQAGALVVCGLCGFLLVTTFSRANVAGALLGSVVLLVFSLRRRWPRWLVLAPAALVLVLALPSGQRGFLVKSLGRISEGLTVKATEGDTRVKLAVESATLLKRTHGLGVGVGNVETRIAGLRAERHDTSTRIVNAHNWWLEVLTSLGLVGFVLYALFYWRLLIGLARAHLRLRGQDDLRAGLSLGFVGSFVGFAVGCVSSSSLIFSSTMWLFFALGAAALRSAQHNETGEGSGQQSESP